MSSAVISPAFATPRRARAAGPVRSARAGDAVRPARPVRTAHPAPGAGTPVAHPTVRLTRRGRIVLVVVFLAALLAALTVFGTTSAATGSAGDPVPTRTVMVEPGDTLWGIAAEVAEPGGTRELVTRIQELNALSSPALQPGQRLAVPVAD